MNYMKSLWEGKLNRVVYFIFYAALCFPFVGGSLTKTDTQPWALLIAIALVLGRCIATGKWERNIYTDLLLFFLGCSVLVGIASATKSISVMGLARSGANYASIFFITIAVYQMLKEMHGIQERWIKLAIWIWFLVGLVQRFVSRTFAYQLLSLPRTSSDRGVVSLASEPSFYGYMCLFFMLFVLQFKKDRIFYMACLLFEIVFLAMSTITILYLIIIVGMYILEDLGKRGPFGWIVVSLGLIGAFVGYLAMRNFKSDNRMLKMLKALYYDRGSLLDDDSTNQRMADIKYSLGAFLENLGIPHGFSDRRIMSGYGAALYEMGILAILLIVLIAVLLAEGQHAFMITASVTVIMFSAIQLACPMVSFYLGYCLYQRRSNKMKNVIQIDLKTLGKWILSKWKWLLPAFILLSIVMSSLLYMNEVIAYKHETSKMFTTAVCLEHMDEEDIREVNLSLAMEDIIVAKSNRLETLRQKDDCTAEKFIEMEMLLDDIERVRALNISFRYAFDDYQNRYYDILKGADENDLGRAYPNLTKKMIMGGIIFGAAMVIALFVVIYILFGYLHSEDEILINFERRVSCVRSDAKDVRQQVQILLETDQYNKDSAIGIVSAVKDDAAKKIVDDICAQTKGVCVQDIYENLDGLEQVKTCGQAIIVAKVNHSKLSVLRKDVEQLKAMNTNILGFILIME